MIIMESARSEKLQRQVETINISTITRQKTEWITQSD